jgi:ribonuclease HI
LRDLGARDVDVFRDSNLIVKQIRGELVLRWGAKLLPRLVLRQS